MRESGGGGGGAGLPPVTLLSVMVVINPTEPVEEPERWICGSASPPALPMFSGNNLSVRPQIGPNQSALCDVAKGAVTSPSSRFLAPPL